MTEEIKVVDEKKIEGVTEETKKEGIVSKAKKIITKHGKKVGAIALAAAVGVVGYALGKKKSSDIDEVDFDDKIETDDCVVAYCKTEEI